MYEQLNDKSKFMDKVYEMVEQFKTENKVEVNNNENQ